MKAAAPSFFCCVPVPLALKGRGGATAQGTRLEERDGATAQSPKRHHDNGQRRGKAQVTAP